MCDKTSKWPLSFISSPVHTNAPSEHHMFVCCYCLHVSIVHLTTISWKIQVHIGKVCYRRCQPFALDLTQYINVTPSIGMIRNITRSIECTTDIQKSYSEVTEVAVHYSLLVRTWLNCRNTSLIMIKHEIVVLGCCVCVGWIAGIQMAQPDVAGQTNDSVKRHTHLLCEVHKQNPWNPDGARLCPRALTGLGPTHHPVQR